MNNSGNSSSHRPMRQRGSVAIEFAFVFPIFFLIFYAIVFYSLAFLVTQNFTFASEEILRKSLAAGEELCNEVGSTVCDACGADDKECRIEKTIDALRIEYTQNAATSLIVFSNAGLEFYGSQGAAADNYCQPATFDPSNNFICHLEIRGPSLLPAINMLGLSSVFPTTLSGKSSLLL
ncbi:pilus assembly protein [Spongiibacter sp. KMU-158]|uniref:Pilus assembly protein n=1 Tax=Spongiibacter pelagi TaxID=2760804 RepID=A0A927BZJ0_9GAMM|nr:TadE family protein [Spongiibacter pelagi]MBD2858479.1 pilus assembly protein [Spongiibacter pelagi]